MITKTQILTLAALLFLVVLGGSAQTLVNGIGTEDFDSYSVGTFPDPTETEWYEYTGTDSSIEIADEFCPDAPNQCLRVPQGETARFRLLVPSNVASWDFTLRWCGVSPQQDNEFSIGDGSTLVARFSFECLSSGSPRHFIYAYTGSCGNPESSSDIAYSFTNPTTVVIKSVSVDIDWTNKQYNVIVDGSTQYTGDFICSNAELMGGVVMAGGSGGGVFFSVDDIVMTDVGRVTIEPAEFDRGLVTFVEDTGFKTQESKMLFALILTGIATVISSILTRMMTSSRLKNYIIMGTAAGAGAFSVLVAFYDMWMFIVAFMLSVFSVRGSKEVRNTYREVTQLIKETVTRKEVEREVIIPVERQVDTSEVSVEQEVKDEPEFAEDQPEDPDTSIEEPVPDAPSEVSFSFGDDEGEDES